VPAASRRRKPFERRAEAEVLVYDPKKAGGVTQPRSARSSRSLDSVVANGSLSEAEQLVCRPRDPSTRRSHVLAELDPAGSPTIQIRLGR
jgi:hypothetical protein